jgi:hypothetical protein
MFHQRFLAAMRPRPQHIETHARHYRGEPTGEILDLGGIGAAEPKPGFLQRVVSLAQRAKHAIRHRPQAAAVFLESLGQFLYRHTPSTTLTKEIGGM